MSIEKLKIGISIGILVCTKSKSGIIAPPGLNVILSPLVLFLRTFI